MTVVSRKSLYQPTGLPAANSATRLGWKARNRSDTTGYGTTPHRNSSTSFVHTAFRNHAPTTTRSNASHVSGAFMGATSIRIRVPCQWRREGSSPHAKTRVGTTSTTTESDGSSAASRAYWGYFRYRSARIRRNAVPRPMSRARPWTIDRKSTRLNSSHLVISYAVFCLKKKNTIICAPGGPATPARPVVTGHHYRNI